MRFFIRTAAIASAVAVAACVDDAPLSPAANTPHQGKPGNDDFYGGGRVNAFRATQ